MFRKINWRRTIITGLVAALVFCIPVFIYIRFNSFYESWLLYMGSFLFLIVMGVHAMHENKLRGQNESTIAMVFISHVAAVVGIIFSCVLCFLMLAAFVPGYLQSGNADQMMTEEPANVIKDKTGGLSFQVFFAATIINFSVGSFVGIVLPFYAKSNQTRDPKDPSPLHQYGAK